MLWIKSREKYQLKSVAVKLMLLKIKSFRNIFMENKFESFAGLIFCIWDMHSNVGNSFGTHIGVHMG
uniref:Uncharacterized protein n=1 Tax=Ciona intestinalis TaxID=7719 RepID=H2Y1P0_CIOIN